MAKINDLKTSVIVTILNEEKTLPALLESLINQIKLPSEIIIVDAGSTDGSAAIISSYAHTHPIITYYLHPGNRSIGRNYGSQIAKNSVLAYTDAGCVPQANWLKELVSTLADKSIDVVAGYYQGWPKTSFESALIPYVLVMPDRITADFLPSTRSMAIRKSVWVKSGGFNPLVDPSEDFEYALRLRSQGCRIVLNSKAIVAWLPGRTPLQAFNMFYHFAFSDAKHRLYRPKVKTIFLRYIFFTLIFGFFGWTAGLMFLAVYTIWTIAKNSKYVPTTTGRIWLPFLQFSSDIAIMLGTMAGRRQSV